MQMERKICLNGTFEKLGGAPEFLSEVNVYNCSLIFVTFNP